MRANNGCSSNERSLLVRDEEQRLRAEVDAGRPRAERRCRIFAVAAASAARDPDPDRRARRRAAAAAASRAAFSAAARSLEPASERRGRTRPGPGRRSRSRAAAACPGSTPRKFGSVENDDRRAPRRRPRRRGRRAGQRADADREPGRGVRGVPAAGNVADRGSEARLHRPVVLVHDPVAAADAGRQRAARHRARRASACPGSSCATSPSLTVETPALAATSAPPCQATIRPPPLTQSRRALLPFAPSAWTP